MENRRELKFGEPGVKIQNKNWFWNFALRLQVVPKHGNRGYPGPPDVMDHMVEKA